MIGPRSRAASRDDRRALLVNATTVVAIVGVLALDASGSPLRQAVLGLFVIALLGAALVGARPRDRALVIHCVAISTIGELFFTQVWGLYTYRLGNVPLYVPPGHGLLCLCSLEAARTRLFSSHAKVVVGGVVAIALGWAAWGLTSPHRDVEGALYVPIFFALLRFTPHTRDYAWTFVLASLVEVVGTRAETWAWAPVQPWIGVTSGNPPSVAAGGYCVFTALAWTSLLAYERIRRPASRVAAAEGAGEPAPLEAPAD